MTSPGDRTPIKVRVTEARHEAAGIRSLVLRQTNGAPLPAWDPGAHIDLLLPDGTARQYSLCGDPVDHSHYRVAVLLEPQGRGGSIWAHNGVAVGDIVRIREPRNHFRLEPAARYLFLAAGIGITPILPMVHHVVATASTPWRLFYLGHTRSRMAYVDVVESTLGDVHIVASDEARRANVAELVGSLGSDDLLYACGPQRLINAIRSAADELGVGDRVRYELFNLEAEPVGDSGFGPSFEVHCARSRIVLQIPSTSTILTEAKSAGISVLSDCQDGICGSCETSILDGVVEHRDHVLTAEEQREGRSMMVCVSRSRDGSPITLDM